MPTIGGKPDVGRGFADVGSLLEHHARVCGDRVALRFEQTTLTYAELEARSRVAAPRFRAGGVSPGDRVGVFLPNSLDYVVAWLALGRLGRSWPRSIRATTAIPCATC